MSKPSRTTNPSSFKFKIRGHWNRNRSMQSWLLPPPQSLRVIFQELVALRNSASV